jgi:uncharacterized membrane protein
MPDGSGQQKGKLTSQGATVLKVLGVIAGIIVMFVAILDLVKVVPGTCGGSVSGWDDFLDWLTTCLFRIIVDVYIFFGGVLILMAEFRYFRAIKFFGFMFSYTGRGFFFLALALLLVSVAGNEDTWGVPFGIIAAVILIFVAIVFWCIACCCVHQAAPRPTWSGGDKADNRLNK